MSRPADSRTVPQPHEAARDRVESPPFDESLLRPPVALRELYGAVMQEGDRPARASAGGNVLPPGSADARAGGEPHPVESAGVDVRARSVFDLSPGCDDSGVLWPGGPSFDLSPGREDSGVPGDDSHLSLMGLAGEELSVLGLDDSVVDAATIIKGLLDFAAQDSLDDVTKVLQINMVLQKLEDENFLDNGYAWSQIRARVNWILSMRNEERCEDESWKQIGVMLDVLWQHAKRNCKLVSVEGALVGFDRKLEDVHDRKHVRSLGSEAQGLIDAVLQMNSQCMMTNSDIRQIKAMLGRLLSGCLHQYDARLQFRRLLLQIRKQRKPELVAEVDSDLEEVQNRPASDAKPDFKAVKLHNADVHLDPKEVQNRPAAATGLEKTHDRPIKLSSIRSLRNKMKDPRYVYLNYTWGIHNNDLTCMIILLVIFNTIRPFMPLPALSMDGPISEVLRMSFFICSHLFLLILPLRVTVGIFDIFARIFFGPLLGFAAMILVSPLTGMAIAYLSTSWAAGIFGYSLAEYRQQVGTEESANVAVNLSGLSKEEKKQRVYTQICSIYCSSVMILFLAAVMMVVVSLPTDVNIYFVVSTLSIVACGIIFFCLLVLSAFMFHGPLVTERSVSCYIASIPASFPFALISELLWSSFFVLEMLVIAAYFGYMLGIYARYKELVPEGDGLDPSAEESADERKDADENKKEPLPASESDADERKDADENEKEPLPASESDANERKDADENKKEPLPASESEEPAAERGKLAAANEKEVPAAESEMKLADEREEAADENEEEPLPAAESEEPAAEREMLAADNEKEVPATESEMKPAAEDENEEPATESKKPAAEIEKAADAMLKVGLDGQSEDSDQETLPLLSDSKKQQIVVEKGFLRRYRMCGC